MRGGHHDGPARAFPAGDVQLEEPEMDPKMSLHELSAFAVTFISH